MFEKLENYLQLWVSVERVESIMTAAEMLHAYGYEAAWNKISTMLEGATGYTTAEIIGSIETTLQDGLDYVLRGHGVVYEGTMPLKCTILEAIAIVQNFEDSASVMDIIEGYTDSLQTFIDLVSLCTTVEWQHFVDGMRTVAPALLDRIAEMHQQQLDLAATAGQVFDVTDDRMMRIKTFMENYPRSLMCELLSAGYPCGLPVMTLINAKLDTIASYESTGAEQAGLELSGLAIASDMPYTSLPADTKALLETLYSDPIFITEVAMAIDKYLHAVMQGVDRG